MSSEENNNYSHIERHIKTYLLALQIFALFTCTAAMVFNIIVKQYFVAGVMIPFVIANVLMINNSKKK